jgi:anti-sigma regulatory factor (Ser/Thr protein kinase)
MEFSLEVMRDPAGVTAARHAVRRRLQGVLDFETLNDTLLAVSELVANAVLHGKGRIALAMRIDGQRVRGEVVDEGTGFEHEIRDVGVEQIGGRGLRIVAQISDRWGVHEGTTHVWFEISRGGAAGEPEAPELGKPEGLEA